MAMALRFADEASLVLIDEFGKGTSQTDGIALLAASLHHWMSMAARAPFVLVSTHYLSVKTLLPRDDPVLSYKTFNYEIHGDQLVQLFQLVDGIG